MPTPDGMPGEMMSPLRLNLCPPESVRPRIRTRTLHASWGVTCGGGGQRER